MRVARQKFAINSPVFEANHSREKCVEEIAPTRKLIQQTLLSRKGHAGGDHPGKTGEPPG